MSNTKAKLAQEKSIFYLLVHPTFKVKSQKDAERASLPCGIFFRILG